MDLKKYDDLYNYILEIIKGADFEKEIKLISIIENNKTADKGIIRTILWTLKPIILLPEFSKVYPYYLELIAVLRGQSKSGRV